MTTNTAPPDESLAALRQRQAEGARRGTANVRAKFDAELRAIFPYYTAEEIKNLLDEKMHHWYRHRSRNAGRKPRVPTE